MGKLLFTALILLLSFSVLLSQVVFNETAVELNIDEGEFTQGVAILDLNGDEISEIICINVYTQHRLYMWNGSQYQEMGAVYGIEQSNSHLNITAADINADTLPDLFMSGGSGASGRFYINSETPPYIEMSQSYNLRSTTDVGCAFFQMFPDEGLCILSGTQLLSLQDNAFVDITEGSGLGNLDNVRTPLFFDIDGDIDDDIFIAHNWELNDGALFRNNGDGTFTDISYNTSQGGFGFGQSGAFGDIDNDGDFDLYLTSGFGTNSMWSNDGTGYFENITQYSGTGVGGYSRGSLFGDFDNDGDLDLFVNRGTAHNMLFLNDGDGSFVDHSEEAGVMHVFNGTGCAAGDLDNDGQLDIVAANLNTYRNLVYINQNQNTSFLKVRLVGKSSNTMALGAIVKLYAVGDSGKVLLSQREIASLTTLYSVNDPVVHFGTGTYENLSVRAVFKSLAVADTSGIAPGQTITLYEPDVVSIDREDAFLPATPLVIEAYPNPFNSSLHITLNGGNSGHYKLKIYDILGRSIKNASVRVEDSSPAKYIWNATDNYSQPVPSGIYFLKAINGAHSACKKVILLK
jgi:hypothetical protein